ncbi:short chain dehydrogenase [Spirosoma spitsbergense]|uniref:short chain dehydrogenase n=1 Tax=Spirosoma spitsbergense TaxID=431554 RepID=UPI00036B7C63|nr:short chain dehydrogenase [Spirosoma spitsbergense]
MKIVVIGATGTIGRAVTELLQTVGHHVVPVSSSRSERKVNISSEESIRALFEIISPFDGLICVAGVAHAGPLERMGHEEFYKGIRSKLMGQVNLVLQGKEHVRPNGFFTLTSGSLAEEPKPNSAGLGLVNGAINGFVVNAALDLPKGIRLNVVSPSILLESVEKYGQSPGRLPIPALEVVEAYRQTVDGNFTGKVVRAYGSAAY